jgi:hypothetical protein
MLYLVVVTLPPGKNPFAVKINNNNNNNNDTGYNKILSSLEQISVCCLLHAY